ncbi:hypothetical protein Vretifemale_4292 [Volvox reticuliferus]|uniref:Uncharacterized protein n=1 Tax=Volvox reticuliferus TaxID=1737510 RepID=A0A8J4C4A0_9CHLO|nr:hypothetical protein Vretifemale_4292 [Volvox reticuliferus]
MSASLCTGPSTSTGIRYIPRTRFPSSRAPAPTSCTPRPLSTPFASRTTSRYSPSVPLRRSASISWFACMVAGSGSGKMMRLARSSGLAWPCTRGLVSAVATLGTVGENQQEQGATDGALGSDRPEDAERTCLGLPPPRRQSSAGAVHDQALAADVFTAGHMSASEALRAYVSAAMHRGPVLPYPNSEPAFPVRAGGGMQGQRHRPVLPSGPTYSELRLAVQHSGILRALPHMVKVPWPETLSVTIQRRMRPQQLQQRQSMQQVLMKFATAIGYDRSSVQGAGFQRYDGQGMRSRWRQGAAWEAAGPSAAAAEPAAFFDYPNRVWPSLRGHADFEEDLYGRPPPRRGGGDTPHDANRIGNGAYGTATAVARLAENAARRGIGSLQRLHEWVVAAAKGTSAAVGPADAGPVANIGRGGAGTQRAAVLHARECGRPFRARSTSGGSSHNGAQLLGAVSNERILSSSNRTRLQHPDDGDEQKGVDVAPDWFRGVLTPSGGDEASAAEIPAARDPSGAFYSCDARAGAMARSAVNANRNPAEAAHLHALMSTDQSSHLDSLNHNSMYATAADTDVQLKVREIRAQGDNDEIDGAAAASTSGGCIALRHTRPQQPLPPPKLRRRGYDVQKGSSAPGKVAADGDDGSEAQRRRRQRHLRAVQRAMQPALYRPYKDSALFVALDVWAGVHIYGCSSNSTARRAAAGAAGRNGDGTGCWLVSHYDHEHL